MGTTIGRMVDEDRCLVCNKYIGKGNDPAICCKKCMDLYEYEVNFNRWAQEQKPG